MGTKLAIAVSLADPGSEDKGCSRRKGHLEVEVRRTLEKKIRRKPLPGAPAVDVLPPIAYHGGTRDSCSGFGK